jgi:hypothetical protein
MERWEEPLAMEAWRVEAHYGYSLWAHLGSTSFHILYNIFFGWRNNAVYFWSCPPSWTTWALAGWIINNPVPWNLRRRSATGK